MKLIFYILLFIFQIILALDPPRVKTSLGIIEGTIGYTYTNKSFFSFEGVPYAQAPIGELRFEKPQNPKPWSGVLKANYRTKCYQINQMNRNSAGNYVIEGEEDCLYLNIYTPTLNQSANLDVIVHIHGGAFMFGDGATWGPGILLNRQVVYANFNYRVGPLGFLSTEDNVIPGNNGLRDQQKALYWVKKLAKSFGGNPNSITIQGLSAGSASVQLHYLLPKSKGLFQRGFGQSGTAINNWALMENPLQKTKKLASLLGCPTDSSNKIKACLKKKHARQIIQSIFQFLPWRYNPFSPWAVVVDGNWYKNDPVLPEHPLNLLRKRKIHDFPLIMSMVSSEGLYPADEFYTDDRLTTIDSRWNELLPHILMYNETVESQQLNNVSQIIRQQYLGNSSLTKSTFAEFVQAVSDRCFVADLEKGIRLHSAGVKSPVYSYLFNYRGTLSITAKSIGSNENIGVSHADDTLYLFKLNGYDNLISENDIKVSELLIDMTLSFIRTGVPNTTSAWEPVSKNLYEPFKILQINKHNDLVPLSKSYLGNRPFWQSLPFLENERLLRINNVLPRV